MSNTRDRDPIGSHLYASLEPKVQDALGHPLRREVVRTLLDSKRALSITQLVVQLDSASAAQVSYHLQVLCGCEVVGSAGSQSAGAGAHRSYKALIGDNAEARSFLRATEELDRELGEAVARQSSRFLTMFRIPRPTRTLRVGLNRKPQGEVG